MSENRFLSHNDVRLRNLKSRTSPERCETGREGGWKIRFSWLIECKLTLNGSEGMTNMRECSFSFYSEGGRKEEFN